MKTGKKDIKCLIWDLDNTVWDGVLLESQNVKLKDNVVDVIKELDSRGILHSIASKNNFDDAYKKLKEYNIDKYFLYPEINWNVKSNSISKICKKLNVGIDTIAFIDDQPFERDEVKSIHPEVECYDAGELNMLKDYERLNPKFITIDSAKRRLMYQQDIVRQDEEEKFQGTSEEFLSKLNLNFIISYAKEEDLKRAEELTVRTHQLNATGITYDFDDLKKFLQSEKYNLYICELNDIYGFYGKIGLALVEKFDDHWHLKLLLMSCRVMSRGVGSILLQHIMNQCKAEKKKLFADFKRTDRNRMMYVAYKFANFKQIEKGNDGYILFENDLNQIQPFPGYINVEII